MTPEEALIKLGESTAEAIAQRARDRSRPASRARQGRDRPERRVAARGRSPCRPSPPTSPTSTASPAATSSSSRVKRRAAARRRDDGHGRAGGERRRRAVRARALGRRRGDEPDDGRRGRRDLLRARRGGRDLAAGDALSFADRRRRPSTRTSDAARDDRRLHAPRRAVPAGPARPERLRRAHDARARRAGAPRPPAPTARRAGARPAGVGGRGPSVPVRVWAELGRTRLPIGRAVGLAARRRGRARPRARRPGRPLRQRSTLFASRPPRRSSTDEWAVRIEIRAHRRDATLNPTLHPKEETN